jgi:hypothetical protein
MRDSGLMKTRNFLFPWRRIIDSPTSMISLHGFIFTKARVAEFQRNTADTDNTESFCISCTGNSIMRTGKSMSLFCQNLLTIWRPLDTSLRYSGFC